MTEEQWADIYREALPEMLRPGYRDERFSLAVDAAMSNGWTPRQAAAAVAGGRTYTGARNPTFLALLRLEDIAGTKAGERTSLRRPEPHGCTSGWIDTDDGPTAPCPTCRPELAARLAMIPAPGSRTPEDYHYLRHREGA